MADRSKRPLVSPIGAKNVAAAKAAFGAGPATSSAVKKEEAKAAPSSLAKKEDPAKDVKVAAKAPSGTPVAAAKPEPVKEVRWATFHSVSGSKQNFRIN